MLQALDGLRVDEDASEAMAERTRKQLAEAPSAFEAARALASG